MSRGAPQETPQSKTFFDPTRAPVVAFSCVAALAVFAADLAHKDVSRLHLDVRAFMGEPWRVFTTVLPHVDVLHLAFNLLWLVRLGAPIEAVVGSARFFVLAMVLGAGAALAEYAFGATGVGLSGVGYGLVAMGWVTRHDPRFAGIVDRRTAVLFVAWFFFCILTTVTGALAVANTAHAAGALLGALAGRATSARGAVRRAAYLAVAGGFVAIFLLGATRLRPRVNFSSGAGADSAHLGWKHLDAHEDALAEPFLRESVRVAPGRADYWFNLGIGLDRLGKKDEAAAAFRRAWELAPDDPKHAEAHGWRLRSAALAAHRAGDFDRARALYIEAIKIRPGDASLEFLWALAERGQPPPPAADD